METIEAAPAGEAGTRVQPDGAESWAPPAIADTGLLVVHGAGTHAPGTTLTEIINPTLERLRAERTLVGVRPFRTAGTSIPGGRFDGVVIEYTRRAVPDRTLPDPSDIRRAIVVEGRWDTSFLDPPVPLVSAWAGSRVAQMSWELFLYHARNMYAFAAAMLTVALLTAGLLLGVASGVGTAWSALVFAGGSTVAFAAALFDSSRAWRDERARRREDAPGAPMPSLWWVVPPALPLTVYHIQRGIVLIVAFTAMIVLPLLAFLVRVVGTIPGLDGLARHTISAFERWALGQAATDVEVISHDYVAAAAIQARVRAALGEVQARLKPGSDITVLAHSAGAPIAWWLLSEPGIHEAQLEQCFRYRLITVGGALNWAKRGMRCDATFLGWPLATTPDPAGASPMDGGGEQRSGPAGRTLWVNVFSTWDPAPHGPVRCAEYAGPWRAFEEESRAPFDATAGTRARAQGSDPGRCDPNVITRNLGSPISAEHSEYFRNQQEFVPLLLHALDPDIEWLADEIEPARREQWSNLRLALISALVRVRIVVFSLPVAYALVAWHGLNSDTVCNNGALNRVRDYLGGLGSWDCGGRQIPGWLVMIALALVCYALVEVYTNFCWASLGRGANSIDWRQSVAPRRWPPSAWRLGGFAVGPLLLVWAPSLLAPLLYWPLDVGSWLYVLIGTNTVLTVIEPFWCVRCLHGVQNPDGYPETCIRQGRRADYPFAL